MAGKRTVAVESAQYPRLAATRGSNWQLLHALPVRGSRAARGQEARNAFAVDAPFNEHFTAPKLYVTWDAASWHRSTPLVEWLDRFNAETRASGVGPTIHLVPLPRSSQFLDVLEAVFSGMKRAVVHHSDYSDVPEMKTAISRHFVERNEHFRKNPRRAGKKIWDIDFFKDYENLRSGNYREW
jgi:hypothetical protein